MTAFYYLIAAAIVGLIVAPIAALVEHYYI